MKTPRVATVHNAIKEKIRDHITLVHVFHMIPLQAICGYGRIASVSATNEATKFAGPHKSRMRQYIIELAHWGKATGP
jgi:hypothetical protein